VVTGDRHVNQTELLAAIAAAEERATTTARNSSIHGPRHWRDVARVGALLIKRGVEADPTIIALFAALHDTQRRTDGQDPDHGERAAVAAAEMRSDGLLRLPDARWMVLRQALIQHNQGFRSADPTIGACWDADRLTLSRVSYRTKRSHLSTQVAAECVREACAGVVKTADVNWADAIAGRGPEPHSGPYTLYHGTRANVAERIRRHGIYQSAPECGIYLTPDKRIAYQFAQFRTNLETEKRTKQFISEYRALAKKMRAHELTADEVAQVRSQDRIRKAIEDDSKRGVIITVQLPEDWPFAFRDHDYMGYATRIGHIRSEYITDIESVRLNGGRLRTSERVDDPALPLDEVIRERELLMTLEDGQMLSWPPPVIPEYISTPANLDIE
jgi:uncharacterized protein